MLMQLSSHLYLLCASSVVAYSFHQYTMALASSLHSKYYSQLPL